VQRRRELDAVVAGLDAQRAVVLLGAPALEAARRLGPGLRLGESGLDLDEAVDALSGRERGHGSAGEPGDVLEVGPGQVLQPPAAAGEVLLAGAHVATRDELVDRLRRAAPCRDGLDHGRRTGHAVPAREDVRLRRLHRVAVDVDVAPLVQPNRQVVVQERGVGGLADRPDDGVGLDDEVAALEHHRPAASRPVRLAELHPHAVQLLHATLGRDPGWRGEEDHLDALVQRLLHLERLGRHLVARAPVDELDVLGALAQRRPDAVDRCVAASDDDDRVPERLVNALGHVAQVPDAEGDALLALPVDPHGTGPPRADGQVDRVEVAPQVLQAQVRAQRLAGDDLDAQRLDGRDLRVERLLGEPVLGDPVPHHAAGVVLLLEHGDGVAGDRGVVRGREAGRAGADDGDPPAARRGQPGPPRLVLGPIPVGGETLDVVDRDGLVDQPATALGLARVRAHPTAHRGEGVAVLDHADGGLVVAVRHVAQIRLDVDVGRTGLDARCHAVGVVVAEQLLEPHLPVCLEPRRVRRDDHAGLDRRQARLHVARRIGPDLDDAQSAVAVGPLEPDVVAQRRHLDAFGHERLEDRQAAVDLDLAVVDRDGAAVAL